MKLAPGLIVADRFRLVRLLGRGGMGSVWLADHLALEIPCAVKFIEGALAHSEEGKQRFAREAKAAALLRSSHVVQILDHGVWEETPYIAMEMLEGEDLSKRLARVGAIGPERTLEIVAQVSRALQKAHQAGIVHRDLKPENIYIVREDEREIVKVLDFGIAKRDDKRDGPVTLDGSIVGTPAYMSPEQARGLKTIDARSDLWSMGVIAYECMTGRLPFDAEAVGDLMMKVISGPVPVPSEHASQTFPFPPSFDGWWAKAAVRDPAERFQTAREMYDALAVAFGIERASQPSVAPGLPSDPWTAYSDVSAVSSLGVPARAALTEDAGARTLKATAPTATLSPVSRPRVRGDARTQPTQLTLANARLRARVLLAGATVLALGLAAIAVATRTHAVVAGAVPNPSATQTIPSASSGSGDPASLAATARAVVTASPPTTGMAGDPRPVPSATASARPAASASAIPRKPSHGSVRPPSDGLGF